MRGEGDEDEQKTLYEVLKELMKNILKCHPTTVPRVSKCNKVRVCIVEVKCVLEASFRNELQCHWPEVQP